MLLKWIKLPKNKKPLLLMAAVKSAGKKRVTMTFLENHISSKR